MKKLNTENQIVDNLHKCNAYVYSCLGLLGEYAEGLTDVSCVEEIDISDAVTAKREIKATFNLFNSIESDVKKDALDLLQKSYNSLNSFLNAFDTMCDKDELYMAEDLMSALETSELADSADFNSKVIDLFPEAKKQVKPFTLVKKY